MLDDTVTGEVEIQSASNPRPRRLCALPSDRGVSIAQVASYAIIILSAVAFLIGLLFAALGLPM